MHKNKYANKNPANYILYHALMEALIEDKNAIDKEVADTGRSQQRGEEQDEYELTRNPSTTKESSKDKDPKVGSKTGKSAPAKDPVEEPTDKVMVDEHILRTFQFLMKGMSQIRRTPITLICQKSLEYKTMSSGPILEEVRLHITIQDDKQVHNKIDDIGSFIRWYCREELYKKSSTNAVLDGPAFMDGDRFHENIISLLFQMEEKDTYPILLSFTHCGNKSILRVLRIILVILPEHPSETKVFHNEDGNPARANIKQALGSYERPHKGVKASANSDIVYFFTSAQDGDPLQDDVRLCLGDDLKKAQDHNQRQVKDESKDHYPKCTRYQMSTS
ncbi:hypothetical protein Tco_0120711 [Tanacetum coccineum]